MLQHGELKIPLDIFSVFWSGYRENTHSYRSQFIIIVLNLEGQIWESAFFFSYIHDIAFLKCLYGILNFQLWSIPPSVFEG